MKFVEKFGRYGVIRDLKKQGGMGILSLAHDSERKQLVILKRLPALQRFPNQETRFRGEIDLSLRLTHPNLVAVYDGGEWDGVLYLAMEWIRGQTLTALVENARTVEFQIPSSACTAIAQQMLE